MIRLTRMNHQPMLLNADLIQHVETTPDTMITLTNGQKFVVLEAPEEVVSRVLDFRRAILNRPGLPACEPSAMANQP